MLFWTLNIMSRGYKTKFDCLTTINLLINLNNLIP